MSHKVTKGFASRGKSTKGWFFGFKLQGSAPLLKDN
ncbi:transposase [Treponema porcinum]